MIYLLLVMILLIYPDGYFPFGKSYGVHLYFLKNEKTYFRRIF